MTKSIRIFVSSPADVMLERRRVNYVVKRLNIRFDEVTIECYRWEDSHYFVANKSFQEQIPDTSNFDLVIGILWSRIGLPPPDAFPKMPDGRKYPSGTAFELLTALEPGPESGSEPDVFVYRKTTPVSVPTMNVAAINAQHLQLQGLTEFCSDWFFNEAEGFKAAYHEFDATDEFERLLEAHLLSWLSDKVGVTAESRWPTEELGSPFCGLEHFDRTHARVFFGRGRTIERYCQVIESCEASADKFPFLVIEGPSGAGKSSLARAGLLPALEERALIPEGFRSGVFSPGEGDTPVQALAHCLCQERVLPEVLDGDFEKESDFVQFLELGFDPSPIFKAVKRISASIAESEGHSLEGSARVVLVIDQAEEFLSDRFTLEQSSRFFVLLLQLLESGQFIVVLTIRTRSLGVLKEMMISNRCFMELLERGRVLSLAPPGPESIIEIVKGPAKAAGILFEQIGSTALDDHIISLATGPDTLPLVQFLLTKLYRLAEERKLADGPSGRDQSIILTFADYNDIGGNDKVLRQVADQACSNLPAKAIAQIPRLVRTLTEASQDGLILVDAAISSFGNDQGALQLIDALVKARVLVKEHGSNQTIRFAHRLFLSAWPPAREAAESALTFNRIVADLGSLQRKWIEGGRKRTDLIRSGIFLEEGKSIEKAHTSELPADLGLFIRKSVRASRLRFQLTVAATVTFFFVSLLAFAQSRIADNRLQAMNEAISELLHVAERDSNLSNLEAIRTLLEKAEQKRTLSENQRGFLQNLQKPETAVKTQLIKAEQASSPSNFAAASEYVFEALDILEQIDHTLPLRNELLITAHGDLSYYLLFLSRFDEAIEHANLTLELVPNGANWAKVNLANALLLSGRKSEAFEIYERNRHEIISENAAWSAQVNEDIKQLVKEGVNSPDFAEVISYME